MEKNRFKAAFCALLVLSVLVSFSGCAVKSVTVREEERIAKGEDKEYLIKMLMENRSPYVRQEAAQALGEIVDPLVIEALISALGENERLVRESVRSALVKIGEPAVEPLIAALKEGGFRIGGNVARTLGEINDLRAVEPLIDALKSENPGTRKEAAWALGELGDKRAVEPLIDVRGGKDDDLRWAAAEALRKILGEGEIRIDSP